MSTFNLSDITFVGAYTTAMTAAHDSDCSVRKHKSASGESRRLKFHGAWYSLPVRVAAASMVVMGCIMGAALVVIAAT